MIQYCWFFYFYSWRGKIRVKTEEENQESIYGRNRRNRNRRRVTVETCTIANFSKHQRNPKGRRSVEGWKVGAVDFFDTASYCRALFGRGTRLSINRPVLYPIEQGVKRKKNKILKSWRMKPERGMSQNFYFPPMAQFEFKIVQSSKFRISEPWLFRAIVIFLYNNNNITVYCNIPHVQTKRGGVTS